MTVPAVKARCTLSNIRPCAVISMFDYSKALLIMPAGYDNHGTALSSLNLLIYCQYTCNGNARINGMDRAGICAHSYCNGSCVEDRQATTGPGRGRGPLTDYYTLAGVCRHGTCGGADGFPLGQGRNSVEK